MLIPNPFAAIYKQISKTTRSRLLLNKSLLCVSSLEIYIILLHIFKYVKIFVILLYIFCLRSCFPESVVIFY